MKKINWKHLLGILALSLVLSFATVHALRRLPLPFSTQSAKTDFGDFSGSSDYGGSWGGSSDWGSSDWGSSSSWDSSDWGYGGYGGYSYGYHYIDWGTLLFYMIILIILYNSASKRKRRPGSSGVPVRPAESMQSAASVRAALSELQERDPGFSESRFLEDVANLYIRLQNAWTDRDLEPVRARLSEELFAASKRGVDQYIRTRRTNHVDRIAVLSTEITGCTKDSLNDTIQVLLNTRITDYVTDDATGRVVSGDSKREKFMTYRWTLIRTLGKQTSVSGTVTAKYCPHCGAPLDLNQSGVCPYCRSVLTSGDHDWVLTKIEGLAQRTA